MLWFNWDKNKINIPIVTMQLFFREDGGNKKARNLEINL
jgi:hypothetical protein